MAFGTRFHVDRLSKASSALTTVGSAGFDDGGAAALNFQSVDQYSTGVLSGDACTLKVEADISVTSGSLPQAMTFAAVWINNYPSGGFSVGATMEVWSDDNSGFATPTSQGSLTFATAGISATQHLMLISGFASSERYWRFTFTTMGTAPQVGMVLLGGMYSVTPRWDWGSTPGNVDKRHGLRQFNEVQELKNGTRLRRSMRTNGAQQILRSWEFLDKTSYDTIHDAFTAARGSFLPFVMVEDDLTAMSAHRLCHFGTDSLEGLVTEPAHQLYNVTLPIVEIPFTNSGVTY